MLTSNVNNYVSVEFNTQKKPHKVVLCYIITVLGLFLPLSQDIDIEAGNFLKLLLSLIITGPLLVNNISPSSCIPLQ